MGIEPGQRIGDYEVIAPVGAGGLGAVYEVRHLISNRREAMKVVLPDKLDAPETVERFRREVQTLAALNHANIAALHNAFYLDGQLYMTMELIHGRTLRDEAVRAGMTLPAAVEIASQVLRALVYAHDLGVVHRDIKPSNIMITAEGVVKLLDFGIAVTERASELTHSGYLLGSLNYMSPEQIAGSKATVRSDLYAVGVTLYELLTGRLPITGSSTYEIMMGHLQQTPVAPQALVPTIPRAVSDAIMIALAKEPQQRFASAGEFLAAVRGQTAAEPSGVVAKVMHATIPATSTLGPMLRDVPATTQKAPSSGFQNLGLEEISRKLAVYIGPVAKLVVKRLAAQSDDIDFIYREAAKQIRSDADRTAFLMSKKR